MAKERYFEVSLKRSGTGRCESQKRTLLGLGLNRFGKKVYLKDIPTVRGMLYKVVHLVDVVAKEGVCPPSSRAAAKAAK